jgi:hypothetical protein
MGHDLDVILMRTDTQMGNGSEGSTGGQGATWDIDIGVRLGEFHNVSNSALEYELCARSELTSGEA